jgi:transcriptional regulator with XRE-family HTH domain
MTHTQITLGEAIRAARESAGLTQRQLAARLGCESIKVSRWERGANEPRIDTLREIAAALGTTAAALVG